MSNSLAIVTVTSVLQNLLMRNITADLPQALVTEMSLGNTRVTTAPLDKARTPPNNVNQINLCLYQVVPNAALRNLDMGDGRRSVALDLHYLVSAYGGNDDDRAAHVLLGQAVRLFNDRAVLTNFQSIRDAVRGNDLAEQIDHVRLTPRALTLEELARIFSMYQTQARASAAYVAGAVLIDSTEPRRVPLPVLRRGTDEHGVEARGLIVVPSPVFSGPALHALELPEGRPFALLGDSVQISGQALRGATVRVRLSHPRLDAPIDLAPTSAASGALLQVTLPNNPALLPAGVYSVSALITDAAGERTTNTLILPLAPAITLPTTSITRAQGAATISFPVSPAVLPSQQVSLILGEREVPAPPRQNAVGQLSFQVPNAAPGTHFVRLRVDGVESDILDRKAPPSAPAFDVARRVKIQ